MTTEVNLGLIFRTKTTFSETEKSTWQDNSSVLLAEFIKTTTNHERPVSCLIPERSRLNREFDPTWHTAETWQALPRNFNFFSYVSLYKRRLNKQYIGKINGCIITRINDERAL